MNTIQVCHSKIEYSSVINSILESSSTFESNLDSLNNQQTMLDPTLILSLKNQLTTTVV